MEDEILTAHEVAATLKLSTSFTYQLMRQGVIPTVRFGRSVRVRKSDLDRLIKNGGIDSRTQVLITNGG